MLKMFAKTVVELNNSRSTTLCDVLSISVYKENWIAQGSVITKICNLCLRSGIVPNRLKTAKTTCIHKGGAHDVISNYRPISVPPAIAKINEKNCCNIENTFFLIDGRNM